MKIATGYYMNLFANRPFEDGRDIFIIFNEPNPEPTHDELEKIQEVVEEFLKNDEITEKEQLEQAICSAVEDMDCECVAYGAQVIVVDR